MINPIQVSSILRIQNLQHGKPNRQERCWYALDHLHLETLTDTPSAKDRLSQVTSHLRSSEADLAPNRDAILTKSPDDVVVTACLRTAQTKGGKGGFKDTPCADLLHGAFKSLLERSKIDPSLVEDIAVGNVLAPGGGATEFRAAALAAGFPSSTGVHSLNRQCSSGLQACVEIANAIKAGMIDIGIGAGVESMSTQYGYVSESRPLIITPPSNPAYMLTTAPAPTP